jgi:hypothetical protein
MRTAGHPGRRSMLSMRLQDSQAHRLHSCTNISLSDSRAEAMMEIQNFSPDTIPKAISSALLIVLHTTDEPERIWTANWSTNQIQHLEAHLLVSQALPSSQSGWSTANDTLLQLSQAKYSWKPHTASTIDVDYARPELLPMTPNNETNPILPYLHRHQLHPRLAHRLTLHLPPQQQHPSTLLLPFTPLTITLQPTPLPTPQ